MEISQILLSLQSEFVSYDNKHDFMMKYNMLMLGDNSESFFSNDFHQALKNNFDVDLSLEDLHEQLPSICASLGMKCEPIKALKDLDNPIPSQYYISLI